MQPIELRNTAGIVAVVSLRTATQQRWSHLPFPSAALPHFVFPEDDGQARFVQNHFKTQMQDPSSSNTIHMMVWEVEDDGDWILVDSVMVNAIQDAQNAGRRFCRYQARGCEYEVDLHRQIEVNLSTGRQRALREVQAGSWTCSECTFVNAADSTSCSICGGVNPESYESDSDASEDSESYTADNENVNEDEISFGISIEWPLHELTARELSMAPADRKECSICLMEYNPGDMQAFLPCFHSFHADCARRWQFRGGNSCPICKYNIAETE